MEQYDEKWASLISLLICGDAIKVGDVSARYFLKCLTYISYSVIAPSFNTTASFKYDVKTSSWKQILIIVDEERVLSIKKDTKFWQSRFQSPFL